MISDLDVYRCASLMVREHGDTAAIFAAQRAHALLAEGDLEGYRVWLRIRGTVIALRVTETAKSG